MSKESESYRLEMLRRLKHKNSAPPPAEVLEAQKVIAKHSQEQQKAREAIPRLEAGLPKPDLCPRCWFNEGHESILYAIRADDPSRYDRMKCRECGYVEDRETH